MSTKQEIAERLAEVHYSVEPGMVQIYRAFGDDRAEGDIDEPIKLLEVNEETIPAGVVPIHFGPHPARGVPFPTAIIEITPEEFAQIGSGLKLPADWLRWEPIARSPDVPGRP